jgi:hypothetical protein
MVQTATMDEAGLRASASTVHVYQDENCSSGSFSVMTQAFSQRISELQQLVSFRVEGESSFAACCILRLYFRAAAARK